MASKKNHDSKSSMRKEKKDNTQDKTLNTYFSPQQLREQQKNVKYCMDDTSVSLESLEMDARKNSDKELITTSQLQISLRANLEEIKKDLAVTAVEIKTEIKQEINLLTAKLQKFEDQVNELDFYVKNVKDECGKSHCRIFDLELKCNDLEDRSRRKNLRFRNFVEGGRQEDLKQTLKDYFLDLGIPFNEQDQLIERCHRLFKPQTI
ncbi:Hypothetical predicted protein [Pelobates cultripes]|uniref:Uncharacterized protein n=1 Tax=Pelobates cultripes TaxID=61616 RepID=A0AAD1R4W4_PELCU|nr:Hypothetical predicted protein [Pelobates cultripes]